MVLVNPLLLLGKSCVVSPGDVHKLCCLNIGFGRAPPVGALRGIYASSFESKTKQVVFRGTPVPLTGVSLHRSFLLVQINNLQRYFLQPFSASAPRVQQSVSKYESTPFWDVVSGWLLVSISCGKLLHS